MMLKKIIAIAILFSIFSCTPYHRMLINPVNLNNFLEDSCDVLVVNHLKQILDTIEYDKTLDQTLLLEDFIKDSECEYYTNRIYPPFHKNSSIKLMTIRQVLVGEDEIVVGNLFTFDLNQDSTFIFQRRVKEYSQMEEFESGKYVVFTYFVKNDSTTIIKAGTRRY